MTEIANLVPSLLNSDTKKIYACVSWMGDVIARGLVPSFLLATSEGIGLSRLRYLVDPARENMTGMRMECSQVLKSGSRGFVSINIDPDENRCLGCSFVSLNCPIGACVSTDNQVELYESPEQQQIKLSINLDKIHRSLLVAKCSLAQFNPPTLLPVRLNGHEEYQLANIREVLAKPEIWDRIVKFHYNYDAFCAEPETQNLVSVDERLNIIRLMLNGARRGFFLNFKKMEKVISRLEEAVAYAVTDCGVTDDRSVGQLPVMETSGIKMQEGLDELSEVLTDPEVLAKALNSPHVYDLFSYIANGNNINQILSAFHIDYPSSVIEKYNAYLRNFVLGKIKYDDYYYSYYAIPSSVATVYFLDGMKYRQVEEDDSMIDTRLLNLAKNLFSQNQTDLYRKVLELRGEKVAGKILNRLTRLRSFFQLGFEAEGLLEVGEKNINIRMQQVLSQTNRLPESIVQLLTMPQRRFPSSVFGIRQMVKQESGFTLDAISIKLGRDPGYITSGINVFSDTLLNLSTRQDLGTMEQMDVEDWLIVLSDHKDACVDFAKLVYRKMHEQKA